MSSPEDRAAEALAHEQNGAITASEEHAAMMVRPLTDWELDAQERRADARAILDAELDGITWEQAKDDPTFGEIAAKLWATWHPSNRPEPFIESDYMNTGIYEDLRLAMNAHGLKTFDERCLELGRKLVLDAIRYVGRCHANDAEYVETELRQARREYARDCAEAAKDQAWREQHGLEP